LGHGIDDYTGWSDQELVMRTRDGDRNAFGELWSRHRACAVAAARSITARFDPEDLTAEAFTRVYRTIACGGGPQGAFRPYLMAAVRNAAAEWGRKQRELSIGEYAETLEDPESSEERTLAALDGGLTVQAFRALPSQWQEALWYSEVEELKPREIAVLLGISARAASALIFRAREGLRQAWIRAHLAAAPEGSECQWTVNRLGQLARRKLSASDSSRVERHLDECVRCTMAATEAESVASRLTLVLLPLIIGTAGASGYRAFVQDRALGETFALEQTGTQRADSFSPVRAPARPAAVLAGAGFGAAALIVAVVAFTAPADSPSSVSLPASAPSTPQANATEPPVHGPATPVDGGHPEPGAPSEPTPPSDAPAPRQAAPPVAAPCTGPRSVRPATTARPGPPTG